MYQRKLAIKIFSCDSTWTSQLKAIERVDGVECWPTVFPEFDAEEVRQADVVIIDIPLAEKLADIRSLCKKRALLIFCGTRDQIDRLTATDMYACCDIWTKPLSAHLMLFYLKELMARIRLRKDYFRTDAYLQTAIDSIPDLVWFKDVHGTHLKVNNAFCDAVGKKRRDVEGQNHYAIWDIDPEEYKKGKYICLESEEMVLHARKTCVFDENVKSKQGMRQFKTYKSPLFDEDGEVMGTVGIAHDATDLGNMTVELKIILQSMPFAILVCDAGGKVTDINSRFAEYFRVKQDDMIGVDFDIWKKTIADVLKVNENGKFEASLSHDGLKRIVEISEEPIVDVFDSLIGRICICRDVTTERTFEERILLNANTDALTGLYNRRYFYQKIEENRTASQISLLYVDLDNFKLINDLYGHQIGDDTLITVGNTLKFCCPDDLICRIGGDEFLIAILEPCSQENLEKKATSILVEMQKVFNASEHMKILSTSIGVAFTTETSTHIDRLIKKSDLALLAAKRRGKAQYCVYSEALQKLVDRRGR